MNRETGARFLIVNADDFGLTEGVNRGVIETHERGIVTSASLMVRHPAARDAAVSARAHPDLSVGLHFEVAEWRYHDGEWGAAYEVVDARDQSAVEVEFEKQLDLFRRLLGSDPTHLDSHQHVHLSEPTRSILLRAAERLHLPLRGCDSVIKYCGSFYGQTGEGESFHAGISSARLAAMIEELDPGWTEVGCHPGYADGLDSIYSSEREQEIRVLCAAETRRALQGRDVRLCSFRDHRASRGPQPEKGTL